MATIVLTVASYRNLGYTQGQLARAIAMTRAFNTCSIDSNVMNVKHK